MKFVKNRKLFYYFIILLFLCFIVLSANICLAQSGIIPDGGKKATGDYELNDFVRVGINASQWILGIVGSLALLMFVYGGLMMILAGVSTRAEGGKDKRINIGKDAIENAIIGLVIVFAAYMIIGFVFRATGVDIGGTAWSKTSWFSEKIKTGETK